MNKSGNHDQVSNVGIPSELGNTAATDGLSEMVEAMTDSIEKAATGEVDAEPTIAPGMNTDDALEEKASEEEIGHHDSTPVTRLFLDRTPED